MTTLQIISNTCLIVYTLSIFTYFGFRARVWRIIIEDQKRDDQLSPQGMYWTMMYTPVVNTVCAIALVREWIRWKRGKNPEY